MRVDLEDREERTKFFRFLRLCKQVEDPVEAYALVYGEVVFEDPDYEQVFARRYDDGDKK